jgi:hypothetical protein
MRPFTKKRCSAMKTTTTGAVEINTAIISMLGVIWAPDASRLLDLKGATP